MFSIVLLRLFGFFKISFTEQHSNHHWLYEQTMIKTQVSQEPYQQGWTSSRETRGGGGHPETGDDSGDEPLQRSCLGAPWTSHGPEDLPTRAVNNFSKKEINKWHPLTTMIADPRQKINAKRLKLLTSEPGVAAATLRKRSKMLRYLHLRDQGWHPPPHPLPASCKLPGGYQSPTWGLLGAKDQLPKTPGNSEWCLTSRRLNASCMTFSPAPLPPSLLPTSDDER